MSQTSAKQNGAYRLQLHTQRITSLIFTNLIPVLIVVVMVALALVNDGLDVITRLFDRSVKEYVLSPNASLKQFPNIGAYRHIRSLSDPLPVPYSSSPPTSGYHIAGALAPWGISTVPIDDKITVHNLEHGGVILHYRQDLDKATVERLTNLARELQQQNPCIILQPRPVDQIDVPIAVTAWTWLLSLQSFDEDAIRSFFQTHIDQGPELGCRSL